LKLEGKYSKEKINFVYNNFFQLMAIVFKNKLASSVYISNFGNFFLSSTLIESKIKNFKRMNIETHELEKLFDIAKKRTNYKWKSLSKKD
jgi:hypothetical protein